MKRLKWMFLLCLVLTIFLAACSGDSSESADAAKDEAKPKDELVFANFRDIRDLNPHLYAGELFAQNMLYESLIKVTEDGFEPWLAKDWDISKDGKVYTFYLRDDVKFHDGVQFDANTAKANFDAILDNIERHSWLELVRLMESVEVLDTYTLQIKMTEPYYPMLTELAVTRPFRFISPNSMIDGTTKDGVNGYIGTGPYALTESKKDEYAVFTAYEDYYGEQPAIKKITMKVIPDNQARVLALQKGEIDLIYGKNMIDAESFETLSQDDQFKSIMSEPISSRIILMNTTNEILTDRKVRQAIQHAVNKDDISEGIFNGSEAPAHTLLSESIPYANVGLTPYDFDTKKSAKLLEEAGWVMDGATKLRKKDGKELSLNLYYNSDTASEKTISEYLQSEFIKLGIQLNIVGEEEQSYRDRQKAGDFDLVFDISWGTPYDPQSFLSAMKLPVYGDYYAQQGLSQKAEIDQNIADALISTDEESRKAHYSYVLTTLHEEAVYIPLSYERNRAVFKKELDNVLFNPSQFEIPFEKMTFK